MESLNRNAMIVARAKTRQQVEGQVKTCVAFALENGFNVRTELILVSGKQEPDWSVRVSETAYKKRIGHIVVTEPSRLLRGFPDLFGLKSSELHFVLGKITGEWMFSQNTKYFGEEDTRRMKNRIKNGIRKRKLQMKRRNAGKFI